MRESLKHARSVEIPHGRPAHDIQPQRPKHRKIHGRIDLFHKTVLLRATPDAEVERHGSNQSLHEELARKGKHNDIERHKGKVPGSFSVKCGNIGVMAGVIGDEWVVGGYGVGEEYGAVERVGWSRIHGVGGEKEYDEDERVEPCMSEGEGFPAPEEGFRFSAFGKGAEGFGLGISLGGCLLVSAMVGSEGVGGWYDCLLVSMEEN